MRILLTPAWITYGNVTPLQYPLYFFETLVRVHRAGGGAPYTGLKPAGRDLGPAVPAGDRALEDGKLQPLAKILMQAAEKGLHEQFEQAMARKKFKVDDGEAGREYVVAYVTYIHYVERLKILPAAP